MKTFGERMTQLREEYDMTKVEMAKRIGKSKSAITRYETGEIQPTLDVMMKLRQSFGKSLDWLAGYDTDENQQYSQIISECESSDIKPEKLQQIINVLKNS
jgi:transcriptional regulator with XRE-family HTH domain